MQAKSQVKEKVRYFREIVKSILKRQYRRQTKLPKNYSLNSTWFFFECENEISVCKTIFWDILRICSDILASLDSNSLDDLPDESNDRY